ncbi:hypothetical protein D3C75_846270 [compost metagenome]
MAVSDTFLHWPGAAALVVELVASSDRASSDDHLCADRAAFAGGARDGEGFSLADLCIGDAGLRFDSVEHAWF